MKINVKKQVKCIIAGILTFWIASHAYAYSCDQDKDLILGEIKKYGWATPNKGGLKILEIYEVVDKPAVNGHHAYCLGWILYDRNYSIMHVGWLTGDWKNTLGRAA